MVSTSDGLENLDKQNACVFCLIHIPVLLFIDHNVARTVERWSIPGYLSEMLGTNVEHRAQFNTNNHFMYATPKKRKDKLRRRRRANQRNAEPDEPVIDREGRIAESQRNDLKPQDMRMTYNDWLEKANKTRVGPEDEHYYFRLIGCGYMGTTGDCDQGSSE